MRDVAASRDPVNAADGPFSVTCSGRVLVAADSRLTHLPPNTRSCIATGSFKSWTQHPAWWMSVTTDVSTNRLRSWGPITLEMRGSRQERCSRTPDPQHSRPLLRNGGQRRAVRFGSPATSGGGISPTSQQQPDSRFQAGERARRQRLERPPLRPPLRQSMRRSSPRTFTWWRFLGASEVGGAVGWARHSHIELLAPAMATGRPDLPSGDEPCCRRRRGPRRLRIRDGISEGALEPTSRPAVAAAWQKPSPVTRHRGQPPASVRLGSDDGRTVAGLTCLTWQRLVLLVGTGRDALGLPC